MTQRLKNPELKKRTVRLTLPPLLVFGLAVTWAFFSDAADWVRWTVMFAAFAALAGYLAIRLPRIMRTFRCPRCHSPIETYLDTGGAAGAAIDYYCKNCDVIWETGITTVTDM